MNVGNREKYVGVYNEWDHRGTHFRWGMHAAGRYIWLCSARPYVFECSFSELSISSICSRCDRAHHQENEGKIQPYLARIHSWFIEADGWVLLASYPKHSFFLCSPLYRRRRRMYLVLDSYNDGYNIGSPSQLSIAQAYIQSNSSKLLFTANGS